MLCVHFANSVTRAPLCIGHPIRANLVTSSYCTMKRLIHWRIIARKIKWTRWIQKVAYISLLYCIISLQYK